MTQFADLRFARTAYEMRGMGAPILLIHGAEASRESLAELSRALSSQVTSPTCAISYDQRESGETLSDGDPHDIPALGQDAAELMTSLGFERFSVMGTSLGGRVAQALAIAYPERVETLYLVNTWPLDRALPELNPEGAQRLRMLRAGLPSTAHDLAAMFYTPAHVAQHPALAQRFAHPPGSSRRSALALEIHELPPERIRARTLCISGEEDQVVPTAVMRALADRIALSTFETVRDAGHSIAVQAPAALARLIVDFMHRQVAGLPSA